MSTAAEREAERKQAARVKRAEKRAQREAEARARNNAASRVRRRADAELAKAQALTTDELVDPLVHAAKVAAEHAARPEPAIERPCINLVRHKVRRVKLVREDGSEREVEIDVGSMPERIAAKRLTEQLGDNLPTCAWCGKKVAPVNRRPGRRGGGAVICASCPTCHDCQAPLSLGTISPSGLAKRRAGHVVRCRSCSGRVAATTLPLQARRVQARRAQARGAMTRTAASYTKAAQAISQRAQNRSVDERAVIGGRIREGKRKLTHDQLRSAYARMKHGELPKKLAHEMNVSVSLMKMIRSGKLWSDVTGALPEGEP